MTAVTALDEPAHPPARDPGRRWFGGLLAAVIGAAILVALIAVVIAGRVHADRHTVTAPVGNTASASVDITSGVTTVSVRSVDLGRNLYRISTPTGAGQVPAVATSAGPAVAVSLRSTSGAAPGQLEVLLSSKVTWRVRITGGATEARLDLRGSPLSGVDLASGVSSAEVWLPEPRGTVTVAETGGVNQLALHAPVRVPVKVTADAGAGTASIDGENHTGVSAGTAYAPFGWETVTDRYDIHLVGGVSQVVLDRFAA
jgi:hypothetical protein